MQLDDARAKMSAVERQLKVEREKSSFNHRDDLDMEAAYGHKPSTTNGDDSRVSHTRKVTSPFT